MGKKFFNDISTKVSSDLALNFVSNPAEHLELKGVLGDYNKLQLEKDPLASLYGRLEENDKPKLKASILGWTPLRLSSTTSSMNFALSSLVIYQARKL
jgi:hypothetical protein